jgi:hypothetical protein
MSELIMFSVDIDQITYVVLFRFNIVWTLLEVFGNQNVLVVLEIIVNQNENF